MDNPFGDLIPAQSTAPQAPIQSNNPFDDLIPAAQSEAKPAERVAPSANGRMRAIGSGLVEGAIGLAGMPGDTQADIRALLPEPPPQQPVPEGAYGTLINYLNRARGALELPTSADITQATGAEKFNYQPQNTEEGYLKTGASFVPMALNELGAVKSAVKKIPAVVKAAIHTFAPAAASEAAGQATEGTGLEPYARAGAAILTGGGISGATKTLEESQIAKGAPSLQDLKSQTRGTYSGLTSQNNAVPVSNQELNAVADNLRDVLNRSGPRPSVAPGIHAAIDEIRTPATANMGDVSDLVSARQNIKGFLGAKDENTAGAAKILPLLEKEIEYLSPGTMKELRRADKDWGIVRANEALDAKVARADLRNAGEHSALNLGNKIKQKTTDLLVSNEAKYLSPQSKEILKGVVKGSILENLTRFAGNALGGGGGIGATILGMTGSGLAAHYSGHPELAALPILGLGARGAYNRMVSNRAARAGALLRSQSSVGGAPRLPTGVPAQNAALAALLAANPRMLGINAEPQR